MNFEITMASGRQFVIDERDATRVKSSMLNVGARSLDLGLADGQRIFISVDLIESVELVKSAAVVDAVEAAPVTR